MPDSHEGLLEKGYWAPAKQVVQTPSTYERASKWAIDLVRPVVFTKSKGRDAPIRRTAWLDGLRGWAAFMVYWHHHQLWAHESKLVFENGFGYEDQHYFVQLPFFRLFFSGGHFAVSIFFIISGYVLSAKPLSLIQSGDYVKLNDNVASALFRRWLRLFMPIIATSFLYMMFFHLVWTPAAPEPRSTLKDELWAWWLETKQWTFVFRSGGEPWLTYNFHGWSIPVEMKGSIAVYTTAIAFSRCTRNVRLWGYVILTVYYVYLVDGWYCGNFMLGMMLGDLDLLAADNNLPRFFDYLKPYKQLIFYLLFAAGIYLGGCPGHTTQITNLTNTPGWYYLSFMKPQAMWDYKWWFLGLGSTLVVASIPHIPLIKSFFEHRFNLYLGRISFSLYLVHGPVLWTLGERLYAATGYTRETNTICPEWVNIWPMSKRGVTGMEPAFILPQLILLPVTFWLAEMVTKLIDEPSLKFATWLYKKSLAPAIKL